MSETPLEAQSTAATHAPLPAELEEALIELLSQALVAELLESRKSVESQAEPNATVASPSGLNHPVADDRNA